MAGDRRLYLYWDPAIDGAFRRRLERALGGLKVDVSDGDTVDPDPENPGVTMAVASGGGGWEGPAKADIVIHGGPGNFSSASGVLRLEAADIDGETQRWARLVETLRGKLGMASLALPAEDLAVQLDDAVRLAGEAEQAMNTARLGEANALRERNSLQVALIEARAKAEALQVENTRLMRMNEAGAFALGLVPQNLRAVVEEAREHSAQAQLAAARATAAAGEFPDQIAWGATASYSGEHRNGKPHGYGVMSFGKGDRIIAYYRGQFSDGRRMGHGVSLSDDDLVWSGQWQDDEACGAGILEAPDGRRFEGRVLPDGLGAPRADGGWTWETQAGPGRRMVHQPAPLSLAAPAAAAD